MGQVRFIKGNAFPVLTHPELSDLIVERVRDIEGMIEHTAAAKAAGEK